MSATTAIWIGRAFGVLALLALGGAWITQVTGATVLGMDQQHLFSEATVFALFAIGGLVDGLIHAKGL